jgi:hypothetical protein
MISVAPQRLNDRDLADIGLRALSVFERRSILAGVTSRPGLGPRAAKTSTPGPYKSGHRRGTVYGSCGEHSPAARRLQCSGFMIH